MFDIRVGGHLDSAHFLREYVGKCSRPHGHRFSFIIVLKSPRLNDMGMVVDFKDIKDFILTRIDKTFDHQMLNDVLPFTELNPTAENLAKELYHMVVVIMSNCHNLFKGIDIKEVTVYESPECSITYYEDEELPWLSKQSECLKQVSV